MHPTSKQRWQSLMSLVISYLAPGFGLLASRSYWRGCLWFLVIGIALNIAVVMSFRMSVWAIYTFAVLMMITWLCMMFDSLHPLKVVSCRRYCAFMVLALTWSVVSAHVRQIWTNDFTIGVSSYGSMKPTLVVQKCPILNDRVLWFKKAYKTALPQRGDIVIFSTNGLPLLGPRYCVKRIAGMPGETISIDPPRLLVNGNLVIHPAIFQTIAQRSGGYAGFQLATTCSFCSVFMERSHQEVKLGSNEYFLLGDNTTDSFDSRYFGPVHRSNIVGKATAIVWPPYRFRDL